MNRKTLSLNKKEDETKEVPNKGSTNTPPSEIHMFLSESEAWRDWHPLAVGFFEQAVEKLPDGINKSKLRWKISYRCRKPIYLAAFETTLHRMNFDGTQAGKITAKEREYARSSLMNGNLE